MSRNDPAIQALIDKLPKPDTAWPNSERRKWLNAMDNVIAIVYGVEPLGQARVDAMLEDSTVSPTPASGRT